MTMAEPAPAATAVCGWYGKLACLGDFGSRRLPPAFVQHCDAWLASGLAASREQLGDDWLRTYLSAPLWRFAWAPGLAGPLGWVGVLMPSVDRVGRYFPLIAARGTEALPSSALALVAVQAWLDHVADAVLDTLRPDSSVASFDARLAAAPPWPEGEPDSPTPQLQRLPGRDRHDSPGPLDLSAWRAAVVERQLPPWLHGQSLWLAQPGDGEAASLSVAIGLPLPQQFSDLLRGAW